MIINHGRLLKFLDFSVSVVLGFLTTVVQEFGFKYF